MFRDLLNSIYAKLPSQCAVCHAWPAQPVCEACVVRFAQPLPRCRTCALPVVGAIDQCGACVRSPPPLDACVAAVAYEYPWSRLIVEFKFGARPGWAASFATLLRSAPWVEPALERADLILAMPLSTQRLRERGFNQALELAHQLAPGKKGQGLLLRVKDTPPQSALKRADRLRNVRHAFAVEPLRVGELAGAKVVLVDDVMTSGASIYAAADTLRSAGVAHITGIVLARAELPAGNSL
jgi:ComF family protein